MQGMKLPIAFAAAAIVMRVLFSADVTDPTCLEHRWATILFGFGIVVTPVSSTFHILLGEKLYLWSTPRYFLKTECILVRVNNVAPVKLMASGLRIDNGGFRFIKAVN